MKKYFVHSMKFLLTGLCLGLCYQAGAQTVQWWDNTGIGTPTSGNWDYTTANWSSVPITNALTGTFTNSNFAVFTASNSPSTTISILNISIPSGVIITNEGIGNATTPAGAVAGNRVQTLNINGPGSLYLPTGTWSMECGNFSSSDIIAINAPIAGPGGMSQHNSGSLGLFGNNTYSGGTAATGGQIIYYNNNNSFGTGPISTSGGSTSFITNGAPAGGTITLANAWNVNSGTEIINFGDGNVVSSGPWTLGVAPQIKNNSTASLTISGAISGAFGVFLETPSGGTMTLSGPNTYTGPTAIASGGTAIVNVSSINSVTTPAQQASSSLGKPSSAANGIITIGNAGFLGTLSFTGAGETSDRVINLAGTTGGATIDLDGTGPLILSSAFTATANGVKTLTLQGSSTAANAINGAIVNSTSATSLTKAQAGSWTLGGKSTFTGGTTISGGTLTVGGSGDLGNGSYAGAVAISSGANLIYNTSSAQTLSGIISGAGSVQQNGTANLTLSGANTYTGTTTVGSSSTLIVSGTGKLAGTGPIVLNGNLNLTSTTGMTLSGLISGSGNFNLSASAATSETLANLNNTFSGLFNVTAGTLSVDGDGSLGAVPGSVVPNYITLNGGPGANLRANTNGLVINSNRGITLGANGGCIQVAGNDTCTYNGIISGSGQFQVGVNATTGLGILVLGGQEAYTNNTILAAGTTRLSATASIGNSSGILFSNNPTLDVSAFAPFTLSTSNTVTVIGATNTPTSPAIIIGAAGSTVDFGTQPVNLSYAPALTNGDASHSVLTVLQSSLELDGGTVNVTNASGSTLDIGDYALIQCTNGFNITSPVTLHYVGLLQPNTTASLVVVGNYLVLQVIPATGYANSQFTNQAPYAGQSLSYGTSTATISGTIVGAGPAYAASGDTVTVAIGTLVTNTTMISDSTGDFTAAVSINTVPPGTYTVTLSYAGNGSVPIGPALDTSTYLTITKAAVTVTASGQTKTYGQSIPTGAGQTAFTAAGLQNSDTIGSVTLAVSGTPPGSQTNATVANSPYTITASAATGGTFNANDYTLTYVTGTLTVNPLPLGLVGTNIYNGSASALFSALAITNKAVSTDVVTLVSGSVTLVASSAGFEPITDASGLTLGGGAAGNYTTAGAIGSVLVKQLPIGLTGTRYYDGTATADYTILTITNVAGSDDVALASGSATLASSAAGFQPITSAAGLTLSGVTAPNYTLTGAIGSVDITVNSNPTPIGFSTANNQMTLSWPLDHTGWQLQAQTNILAVGINTNWVNVSGSTTTNQVIIPIDPANGCVFYQLIYTP